MNRLNGGEAQPTFVPPRPYERGVGGRPTLVANAETYAHIALIVRHGPEWFRTCGTLDAPGTALVHRNGSGRTAGRRRGPTGHGAWPTFCAWPANQQRSLQAVLTGGYGRGTWLTMRQTHTPTTPAAFAAAGAALGPGVVVALAARACGPAESGRILRWLADETAGHLGTLRLRAPRDRGRFRRPRHLPGRSGRPSPAPRTAVGHPGAGRLPSPGRRGAFRRQRPARLRTSPGRPRRRATARRPGSRAYCRHDGDGDDMTWRLRVSPSRAPATPCALNSSPKRSPSTNGAIRSSRPCRTSCVRWHDGPSRTAPPWL